MTPSLRENYFGEYLSSRVPKWRNIALQATSTAYQHDSTAPFADHEGGAPSFREVLILVLSPHKLSMQMILPSSPSKPLLFTEKRTIRKGATLSQYSEEIAALFAEQGSVIPDVAPPASWTPESTLQFVHAIVKCVIPSIADDDHDLFDHGCTR